VRAVEGEFWLGLLIIKSFTSCKNATEYGLLDDWQETFIFTNCNTSSGVDMDLNVRVGVDEHN
jgi:hypothetical protein